MPDLIPWWNQLPQPGQQQGPDIAKIITAQQLAEKLKGQRQVNQGYNALGALYSNPANVDEKGNLRPEAWQQLMTVAPAVGLEVQGQQLQNAQRQAANTLAATKVQDANRNWLIELVAEPAVAKYEEVRASTGSDQAAQQAAQDVYSQNLDTAKRSGRLAPQEAASLSPQFDYSRARTNVLGLKGVLEQQHKAKAEARADEAAYLARKTFDRGDSTDPKLFEVPDGKGGTKQQMLRWDKDQREYFPVDGGEAVVPIKPIATPSAAARQFSPSKEIAVVDKDGNVTSRLAARESTTGTGWVRSDTGEPITPPAGGHIDVGPNAAPMMGSRESVFQNRVLNAGVTAATGIKALTMMPSSVSSGLMGFGTAPVGLLDAPRSMLANALTAKDTQLYNAAMIGVGRSLAQIETSGLAPGAKFSEQFSGLALKPTDALETKLFKLADMRQIVENGMVVLLANPRVAPEQRKLAEKMSEMVREAVPWTIFDVVALQNSKDPKATLKTIGVKDAGGRAAPTERAASPAAGTAGADTIEPPAASGGAQSGGQFTMPTDRASQIKKWNDGPPGVYVFPDGSTKVKP